MSEHDARTVANGEAVCANCGLPMTPQELTRPCRGFRHQGSPPGPPLCGAPPAPAGQIWINAINCPDCLSAIRGLPAHRPSHDLRIWGDGLACARCGQWGADHLRFFACGDLAGHVARAGCAPSRYPEWPEGGFPSRRAETEYDRGNPPLCGGRLVLEIARAMKSRREVYPYTPCGRCREAFAALPRLPEAAHDARLLPAGDGAGCAACGAAAASAAALGDICDGGRVLDAIAGRRAGRNRAWVPGGARPQHARLGCASAGVYDALRIEDGLARANGRSANRMRVTCVPCVRAIARSPALPA